MDEMTAIAKVSRVVTEFVGDRCPWKFHQFQVDLITLREKAMTIRDAILEQNEEFKGMRVVYVELMTKKTHVREQLDSQMVKLECTLENHRTHLSTYIDGACSGSRLSLHLGEGETYPP